MLASVRDLRRMAALFASEKPDVVLHAAALKWLEEYTGIPYPWGKFDFVMIPAFQFFVAIYASPQFPPST